MKKLLTILSLILTVHAMAQEVPPPGVIVGTVKVKGGGTDTTSINNRINAKLSIADYIVREIPAGIVDNVNTVFTLVNTPVPGKESVFRNGLLQDETDYSISGKVITFATAPRVANKIYVTYLKQ